MLAAIVALALLLRLPGFTESVWYDELSSTRVMLESFTALLRVVATDAHPPFYALVMFLWVFNDFNTPYVLFGTALHGELPRPTGVCDPAVDKDNDYGLIGQQWLALKRFGGAVTRRALAVVRLAAPSRRIPCPTASTSPAVSKASRICSAASRLFAM